MKLFVLFFICSLGLAYASDSYAQTAIVNVEVQNKTVREVLKEIENQSEFGFFFNNKHIDLNRRVSVTSRNSDIFKVLEKVFEGTNVKYSVLDKKIVLTTNAENVPAAQQAAFKVNGKVVDENGEEIIGATVQEKGTANGTVTDMDGNFELKVFAKEVTLEVSYIGYSKAIVKAKTSVPVRVTLKEDSEVMDEVIVVGYGTKKKINLTGAVAAVDGKALVQTPVSNISDLVAGRMPGVMAVNSSGEPSVGSSLSIRGKSTLNNNNPLVVIDGIPRDSFNALDPNEIESITVLKDGAAAAVYGARANNGVFLVTTKRGKKEKMSLTYSGSLTSQSPTMYPKLMDAYQFASFNNIAMDNMGYDRNNPSQASRYYSEDKIEKYRTGQDGGDWYKATFKDFSLMQNHNVTINGGTDIVKYFLSLGALSQDGMYDNINYTAYKFRSNVDADITKNLRIGANLEGRYEVKKSPSVNAANIFHYATKVLPTLRPYYPSGRPINTAGEHVVEQINSGYDRKKYNTFQGTLTANLKLDAITQGLALNSNVSFGKYYSFGKSFYTPYTMYTEDENGNVIGSKTAGGEKGKTALSESFNESYTTFLNIGLNYQRVFGKHDWSGILIYEQNQSLGEEFSGSKRDFPISSKDELFVSGNENQLLTGKSKVVDARKGVVGRIGYIYDSKYLFEASLRADASYIFPKDKRWGYFPSVSAGWRVSEERFFKENSSLDFISNLKLRASFAQVGNDKVDAYQWEDSFDLSSANGPFYNGEAQCIAYYGVFPNAIITWETANNYNFGVDVDFWSGKFSVELDYFVKDTKDILWSRDRSVPKTFGRKLPKENYACMINKGFEVVLAHSNQVGKLNYNLRFTSSYAKNRVTQIDDPSNGADYQKQLNRPLGFIAGYKSLGLFQSDEEAKEYMGGEQFGITSMAGDIKYVDIDKNGVIDSRDQTVLSKNGYLPQFVYGFSGDASWNNFDFSFLMQGAAGRNVMLSDKARIAYNGGGNTYAYLTDAWSPDNSDAKYPLLWSGSRSVNDRNSDFWLRNASYLRLKNIALGYTFSKNITNKLGITKLRVSISGQNLLTWSPLKEFDPEAGSDKSIVGGNYYPQQKSISIGLNVNF